jgi:hypothetical protein
MTYDTYLLDVVRVDRDHIEIRHVHTPWYINMYVCVYVSNI